MVGDRDISRVAMLDRGTGWEGVVKGVEVDVTGGI